MANCNPLLVIVKSNYGVTVVLMIPMNFKVPLANSIAKSHEVQVISLLTLHHKSIRVRTQILMSPCILLVKSLSNFHKVKVDQS